MKFGYCNVLEDFPKDTVGKQFVRSANSISANTAEGFGRYHYKEIKTFVILAEDIIETKGWIIKSKKKNPYTRRVIYNSNA